MAVSAMKLRAMRPAPTSSTSVRASSRTTSADEKPRICREPVLPRPPCLRIEPTDVRATCSAGARPKIRLVPTQIAAR